MIDLRLGRWQGVLWDAEADVMIADPPYSPRQKKGYRSETGGANGDPKKQVAYDAFSPSMASELAAWADSHVRWWVVLFGDHITWGWLEEAFQSVGWFTFAPVIWAKPDPVPRMAGDGPASAVEHLLVARPRRRLPSLRIGSRPGWYEHHVDRGNDHQIVGQKPLGLMSILVRDYTLPGDIVVDPFAGTGTTLVAAHRLGRNALGAEVDAGRHKWASKRCDLEMRQQELELGV